MTERFTVRVTKDYLVFSAGHFITFADGQCERVHGHNWRVAVEVDGPLAAGHYVFDFIALKDRAMEIVQDLDHRMLVATKNPLLPVTLTEKQVEVRYRDKLWSFPREDCALLPIENTTAELLAKHFAGRLLELLKVRHQFVPTELRVKIEEAFGQSATYCVH